MMQVGGHAGWWVEKLHEVSYVKCKLGIFDLGACGADGSS